MLIGIGDNCIDCYVGPIGQSFVGGNTLNVVANARKYGRPAAYIGSVGNDQSGQHILQALQELGIDTSYAGDAFIAGFLNSVIDGGTAEQNLKQTSQWAAESCRATELGSFSQQRAIRLDKITIGCIFKQEGLKHV